MNGLSDNRQMSIRLLCRRTITVILAFLLVFMMTPLLSDGQGHVDAASGGCVNNYTWTEWSTAAPPSGTESQSKTEYRYRTKSSTSTRSSSSPGTGWTYDYSALDSSWTWGAWSAYSTTKYTASETTTTKREVQSQTTPAVTKTQYNYSRWASNSNNTGQLGPCKGTWSGVYCQYYFEKGWSDTALAVSGTQYSNQMGGNFNLYGNNQWFNQTTRNVTVTPAVTKYRYRDGTKGYTYYWYKWNDWTNWSDSSVSSTSSRQVETRTVYRYKGFGAHKLNGGQVTKAPTYFTPGVKTYTCASCGQTVTQSMGTLSLAPVTPAKTRITSAKVSKKKLTIKWKRVGTNTAGYQICLKDKKTGKEKYYVVKQSAKKKLSKKIGKLTKKRTYAVRLRPFNIVEGRPVYGAWSNVKSGKVK